MQYTNCVVKITCQHKKKTLIIIVYCSLRSTGNVQISDDSDINKSKILT